MREANTKPELDYFQLATQVRNWANSLGFSDCGISDINLATYEKKLFSWLEQNFHGEMDWMESHGSKRSRPNELEPGTCSVITVRLDYLPEDIDSALSVLADSGKAYVSRYALGRDYHKMMRKRLQALAVRIGEHVGEFGYRAFVDSAPVL